MSQMGHGTQHTEKLFFIEIEETYDFIIWVPSLIKVFVVFEIYTALF